ncbi:MAG: maleylpyruvate isomerase N-terminal domain-containing protein [Chloroflexi bacterium]|nr:maleylpyruvate isomerase N-terminal domain-containing protein [Chloroflexota bacterium]
MTDRAATLGAMHNAKTEFESRLDRIDEAHGSWEGAVGEWSVTQLLQHMHGWLTEMTTAVERMNAGQRPTPDGVDYSDPNDWNPGFVAERGEQTYEQARAAFADAHEAFVGAVGQVDAARFGEGKTINRMVEGVVTHHYAEHAEDIDSFFGG